MNPGIDGQLRLDDFGQTIGPRTSAAEFAESPAGAKGKIRYAAEFTEVELGACKLQGSRCAAVMVRFVGPKLSRIDVMLPLAGDEKGWANWTMDGEMRRKAAHDKWGEEVFGVKLEPTPMDGIIPFEITAEYPRSAVTPWGRVASYYDSKGGFAYLCVHYG
jgi:hypothetical protein